MNKKLYIIPLLAVAAAQLTSCSDDESGIFDDSAAERLELSKKSYSDALSAEGGLWEFQYFSNSEEPGYIFICQFEADGSVTFHTDHKWIGNTYKSEKSLWEVISDNGTVLTFNSYNSIFHIFSDPDNIVGPDAPTNEGSDINELGYGHNGDYEFMLMSNDGQSIRLVGKKRGLTAWLNRLPADTDIQAYLSGIRDIRNSFSKKFPTLCLTEKATGARYDVNDFATGVASVMPYLTTNPYAQTVTGNGIFTTTGFRFMNPLIVTRMDDTTWQISDFIWNEEGALESDNALITAQAPGINLANVSLSWRLDKESLSPALLAAHDAASAATQAAAGTSFKMNNIDFGYNSNNSVLSFSITFTVGRRTCRDFGSITFNETDTEATIALTEANKASADFDATVPEYTAFKNMFCGEFSISNITPMDPTSVVFTSKSNPDVSFAVTVK